MCNNSYSISQLNYVVYGKYTRGSPFRPLGGTTLTHNLTITSPLSYGHLESGHLLPRGSTVLHEPNGENFYLFICCGFLLLLLLLLYTLAGLN